MRRAALGGEQSTLRRPSACRRTKVGACARSGQSAVRRDCAAIGLFFLGGERAANAPGSRERPLHAVFLRYRAHMVSGGDGTCDGGLLLVVGQALTGEIRAAALRGLDDDRGLDVSGLTG